MIFPFSHAAGECRRQFLFDLTNMAMLMVMFWREYETLFASRRSFRLHFNSYNSAESRLNGIGGCEKSYSLLMTAMGWTKSLPAETGQ